MIIRSATRVRTGEPATYAWAGLRRYQNVDFVTERLINLHKVLPRHRNNVQKQAQQIRFCLIQAREYFAAAQTVSIATKPNLLYYGTMSLALAEILFKQSGDSSLDKARAEHRHHGLTMSAGSFPTTSDLATSAGHLRASPIDISGTRRGTFELWHRTAREHPLAGLLTIHVESGGSVSRYETLFGAIDERFLSCPTTEYPCSTAFHRFQ